MIPPTSFGELKKQLGIFGQSIIAIQVLDGASGHFLDIVGRDEIFSQHGF